MSPRPPRTPHPPEDVTATLTVGWRPRGSQEEVETAQEEGGSAGSLASPLGRRTEPGLPQTLAGANGPEPTAGSSELEGKCWLSDHVWRIKALVFDEEQGGKRSDGWMKAVYISF